MKTIFSLRTLILLALLAALCAVFKAFMSFPIILTGIKTAEVSLAPIPVLLAGVFFGPLEGGLVGFVGETAGFFIGVQTAGYNPIFSLILALLGIIAGLFCFKAKKISSWRLVILTAVGLITTMTIKILIVWLYYGMALVLTIIDQSLAAVIELPVFILLMIALVKSLSPIVNSRFRMQPNNQK